MDHIRTQNLLEDLLTNNCRNVFLESAFSDSTKSKMMKVCGQRCNSSLSEKMYKHPESGLWFCIDATALDNPDKNLSFEEQIFQHATGRI